MIFTLRSVVLKGLNSCRCSITQDGSPFSTEAQGTIGVHNIDGDVLAMGLCINQPIRASNKAFCTSIPSLNALCFLKNRITRQTRRKFPRMLTFFHAIPNALDRLSPPLTLPSQVTFPPALWILLSSCSSSGLWSTDISSAIPLRHNTHRESPTFATVR